MATNISESDAGRKKPATKRPRAKTQGAARRSTGNGAAKSAGAKPASESASPRPARARTRRTTASRKMISTNNPMIVGAAAAAAGVLAGLAATVGRKAAVQAVSALSGDWLDTLKNEHRAAMAIFDKIEATTDEQAIRRMTLLTQLKHALSKHAFQEENVVYPAIRDLGDKEEADKLNHEHGYVKQYLYDLENMPRDDVRWLAKIAEFRRDLKQHVREEEDRIFPALRMRLSPDQNAKVSAALNKAGFKLA